MGLDRAPLEFRKLVFLVPPSAQISLIEEEENPGQDLRLSQQRVHVDVHRPSADYHHWQNKENSCTQPLL